MLNLDTVHSAYRDGEYFESYFWYYCSLSCRQQYNDIRSIHKLSWSSIGGWRINVGIIFKEEVFCLFCGIIIEWALSFKPFFRLLHISTTTTPYWFCLNSKSYHIILPRHLLHDFLYSTFSCFPRKLFYQPVSFNLVWFPLCWTCNNSEPAQVANLIPIQAALFCYPPYRYLMNIKVKVSFLLPKYDEYEGWSSLLWFGGTVYASGRPILASRDLLCSE